MSMLATLRLLFAARSMMSWASRLKLKPACGIGPHTMTGPMMRPVPMIHTAVNLHPLQMRVAAPSYDDVAPSDDGVPNLWSDATGMALSAQGWQANISDIRIAHQMFAPSVNYGRDERQLLHHRADSFMDQLELFEDPLYEPIAPLYEPIASLRTDGIPPSPLKSPKYRRHDKVVAILGNHSSRSDTSAGSSQRGMRTKLVPTLQAVRLIQESQVVCRSRSLLQQQVGTSWQVGHLLGRGKHTQVWELTFKNKKYAGKVINRNSDETDEKRMAKFQNEVAMQKLVQEEPHGANNHLVRVESDVLKLGTFSGDLMVTMELMPGGDLHDKLDEFRRDNKSRHVFKQIVLGVKHMHEAGVVHLDLKPHNIFCNDDRKSPTCKIGDFGYAMTFKKSPEHNLSLPTLTNNVLGFQSKMLKALFGSREGPKELKRHQGTDGYKSPEIYNSLETPYWGPEVDVWALGVTLYVMLTGEAPFKDSYATCYQRYKPLPASFDMRARNLIDNMLRKDPDRRYTMKDVAAHPYVAECDSDMEAR